MVTKQTKDYVIALTKQALVALKRNEFESAEDYLRSTHGELKDDIRISGNDFGVVSSHKKLKFLQL